MKQEKEFEQFLGGAPKEMVKEFAKPGELSEDELMDVLAGVPDRNVSADMQLQNEDVFRRSVVDNEKAAMFQELDQQSQVVEEANKHTL